MSDTSTKDNMSDDNNNDALQAAQSDPTFQLYTNLRIGLGPFREDKTECVICIKVIEANEVAVNHTSCPAVFHAMDCLRPWLKMDNNGNDSCPWCKGSLGRQYPEPVLENADGPWSLIDYDLPGESYVTHADGTTSPFGHYIRTIDVVRCHNMQSEATIEIAKLYYTEPHAMILHNEVLARWIRLKLTALMCSPSYEAANAAFLRQLLIEALPEIFRHVRTDGANHQADEDIFRVIGATYPGSRETTVAIVDEFMFLAANLVRRERQDMTTRERQHLLNNNAEGDDFSSDDFTRCRAALVDLLIYAPFSDLAQQPVHANAGFFARAGLDLVNAAGCSSYERRHWPGQQYLSWRPQHFNQIFGIEDADDDDEDASNDEDANNDEDCHMQ